MNLLAVIASCFDSWLARACSTLFGWGLGHCSLLSIIVLLIHDRHALLHVQVGHVVEVGHLSFSYTGQELQSIVDKLSNPILHRRDNLGPRLLLCCASIARLAAQMAFCANSPCDRAAVGGHLTLPRRLSCAPMHEHWPMAPQGFRSHPPGWHETRLFSEDRLGKYNE